MVHGRYGPAVHLPQLPTPPRGDAVAVVFRREQPNSTGGTRTRVSASFTGATLELILKGKGGTKPSKSRNRESGKAETKASASRLGSHRAADGHVKELASAGEKNHSGDGRAVTRKSDVARAGHRALPQRRLRRKKSTANATRTTSLALLEWRVKGAMNYEGAHPDTAPDGNVGRGAALTVVHVPAAQGNPGGGSGLTLKRSRGAGSRTGGSVHEL